METITTIGLDIAKPVFQVQGCEMMISASTISRSKTELGPSLSDVTTKWWP